MCNKTLYCILCNFLTSLFCFFLSQGKQTADIIISLDDICKNCRFYVLYFIELTQPYCSFPLVESFVRLKITKSGLGQVNFWHFKDQPLVNLVSKPLLSKLDSLTFSLSEFYQLLFHMCPHFSLLLYIFCFFPPNISDIIKQSLKHCIKHFLFL